MSITNRVSVFFLLALAFVLVGFSATIYALASWHLHAQLDRQVAAAMDTLIASVEVHRDDVTWEPYERHLVLGNLPDLSQVRWTLHDEQGQLIDCSTNMSDPSSVMLPTNSVEWRQNVLRMSAGHFIAETPARTPTPTTPDLIRQLPEQKVIKRASMTLCVALSELPVRESLNKLLLTLAGVSLLSWVAAALGGRWLCMKALGPIKRMADKARLLQQTPEHPGLLDVSGNQDELTDLGGAFNQLILTLRESIKRQSRFAGDASHQLRTPLAAMLMAVDVTLRKKRSSEVYENALAAVQRRGQDLQEIVETLLALTRNNSTDLSNEQFDLNVWCQSHLEKWPENQRADDLELRLTTDPLLVCLPKSVLVQIVDNLLDNACKYGAVNTPIIVKTRSDEHYACLSVQDHGIGLSAKDLIQLFEPFFRSAAVRSKAVPGYGLGLALAKHLATAFGGSLEASSVEGEGSQFTLKLPLAASVQKPTASSTVEVLNNS
jgi:two-component system OmpR family sensor kinase